jgi:site-specific recombinase XerD
MGLENVSTGGSQAPDSSLENTNAPAERRRGRPAAAVPEAFATVLADYAGGLAAAPLSAQTRRTYASKVRQYLIWLDAADTDGDPLTEAAARDWAVRDYRTPLTAVLKREPRTVNNALAAVDDFYLRLGLGPAAAKRAELPKLAPRALGRREAVKYMREVEHRPSPRDRAIALTPFYAGARIAEVVGLDVDTTSHVLRHTFATTLVRAGTDLVTVPNSSVTPASTTSGSTPSPPKPTRSTP